MDNQSSQAPRGSGDNRPDEIGWEPGQAPRGRDVSDPTQRRFADRTERANRSLSAARESTNLADILERVLDKGIVVAGDITLAIAGVDLLTLKIRLLVASVDKAQEIGINWWQTDPYLSSRAKEQAEVERDVLERRIEQLEARLGAPGDGKPKVTVSRRESDDGEAAPEGRRNRGGRRPQVEEPQAATDAAPRLKPPSGGD